MGTKRVFALVMCALVVVFPIFGGVASAHHSGAHYGNVEKTLKGTVVEFKWRNPHVFIVWEVKDDRGKAVQWIGELASVTSSIADGMTKDSLKPGDQIIVSAFPTKAGTPESLIKKIVKADGTPIVERNVTFLRER